MKNKKVTMEQAIVYTNAIDEHKTLQDTYKVPSWYKYNAYDRCVRLAKEYNAMSYGITGHNCMQFTFGFYCEDENGVIHIYKITKDHDYELIVK